MDTVATINVSNGCLALAANFYMVLLRSDPPCLPSFALGALDFHDSWGNPEPCGQSIDA